MPEYSENPSRSGPRAASAAVPEKKRKGKQRDGNDDQARPLESLANARAHRRDGAWCGLKVRIGNPLVKDDSILENEAAVVNSCDDSGAHFSVGKIAMNKAVIVHAEFLNGKFVAGFLWAQLGLWPGKAATSTRLRRFGFRSGDRA